MAKNFNTGSIHGNTVCRKFRHFTLSDKRYFFKFYHVFNVFNVFGVAR